MVEIGFKFTLPVWRFRATLREKWIAQVHLYNIIIPNLHFQITNLMNRKLYTKSGALTEYYDI